MAKKGYFSAKNVAWRELPSGYTQVEYLQSSGTQYIDTGFKPNQDTGVTMDFEVTDTSVTSWLFCGRTAANNSAYGVYAYTGGASFYFVYGTGRTDFSGTTAQRQICTVDKNKCTIQETTVTIDAQTFTSSATLCLLVRNTNGTLASFARAKIYSCRIYDNGTLIRDYVPCLNASGTAGLYDTVNGVFYGNAGTGSFAVGEPFRENVAREPKKVYFADNNGIARMAKKAYFGDKNGIARLWHTLGTSVSTLAVGSSVFMNVNGTRTEFVVAHHGLPSSDYDSSCDGTWLLTKDHYGLKAWNNNGIANYADSEIHGYLNGTFVDLFDSAIRNLIKQVKIPYTDGYGESGSVITGAGGLSAKVFLLSVREVFGDEFSAQFAEGSILDWFSTVSPAGNANSAPFEDISRDWWLRTPHSYGNAYTAYLGDDLDFFPYEEDIRQENAIRPALILPSDALVDENFNVLA